MRITFLFFLVLYCSFFAQENKSVSEFEKPNTNLGYLDPRLSIEERVNDLVSRLTLQEKVSQMVNNSKAVPRLNIPQYNWWNEGLHGVARSGIATVFPQAIGLAATWNNELILKVADVISTEARAKHNFYYRKGEFGIYKGLTFWSPNINIFRDPRWGRGQETYGEDPFLTSQMGISFVKGLQGTNPKYFKVIATPKHYAVHSGPEPDRHTFDAIVDNYDLYNTYLPAFKACIQDAGAYSVMCAYNRFMGDACCGSPKLLKDILRNDWGFKGYIVSDCGAIDDIFENHKIVNTAPEASAIAVKSGTDLECGNVYESSLINAVKDGLLSEDYINTSVKRLFTARFKLGMFDSPALVEYAQIPLEANDTKEHRNLAIKAAQESIVLLKNKNNILPLKKDIKKIAVIGPTADSYAMLLGNYNGTPSKYVTPLQGLKNKLLKNTDIGFEPGCDIINKGTIRNDLSLNILKSEEKPGLKAEVFSSIDFSGIPYLTKLDAISGQNWPWSLRLEDSIRNKGFSVRWSGTINVPETGKYRFFTRGNNSYRLYINNKIVVESWNNDSISTKSSGIYLEKEKLNNITVEYSFSKGRPNFFIQFEILDADYTKRAIKLADNSDVVIFIGGITAQLEGEEMPVNYDGFKGGDRTNLNLPEVQENLLKLLYNTGKPIVLVLTSGSALSVNWEKDNIPAIIQLWYPGEEGGTALADVLFGDYNPAGRLPITFYKSASQLPAFEDYNMKGRTYRYFQGEPLFPFGYGLSYSKFKYSNLKISEYNKIGDSVKISVDVKNISKIKGDEVIQLYVKDIHSSVPVPIHSLQGFKRINLQPNEKQKVEFTLLPKQFSVVKSKNDKVKYVIEPGEFEITVGGFQPGTKTSNSENLTKRIIMKGEEYIIE